MNANGCTHAGADPEGFRLVEPDPLLKKAAVLHEGEAAHAHLEGAEPMDLRRLSHLALELGSVLQTAGAQARRPATVHGRGHVQGQLARTTAVDRGRADTGVGWPG